MKTKIFMVAYIFMSSLALLIVSSCNKEDHLNGLSKSAAGSKILPRWDFEDYEDVLVSSAATRRVIQIDIIDHDTGTKTTVGYDCTKPGKNCDVGGGPNKDGKGYLVNVPHNISLTEHILTADSAEFAFPVFFEEPIYSDLQDNILELQHEGGFLVLKDTATWTPLFAYEVEGYQYRAFSGTAEYRVPKMNSETNILECKEEGNSCKVSSSVSNTKVSLLQLFDSAFPLNDIYDNFEAGYYSCRMSGNVYGLIPRTGTSLDTMFVDLTH